MSKPCPQCAKTNLQQQEIDRRIQHINSIGGNTAARIHVLYRFTCRDCRHVWDERAIYSSY